MATKGTEKHARVVLRLIKGGTKLTKRLFEVRVSQLTPEGHIPSPWTIDEFLVSNKGNILANDAGRKKEKTYFPGILDKTNLEHWDLSMFCYVLLESCELDPATRMDVRELRKLRNKLSHLSEPSLDDEKYTRNMEKLEVIFDRILKKIGDTYLDIEIKSILNSSKDDELSLCNTYKEIYKFFQMEGDVREVLSEHTKDHKAILDKLDIIVEQTKNTDGAVVELPETDVYILVKNCNTEKEKLLSEWLKRLIDEKINKQTTLADEMSNESFRNLREAVDQAVKIFFSNGRLITSTENKCVLLRVRCMSLKHLVNLFRDCISGKLTEQMKPLEAAVKEIQDFENIALEVAIYTDEFWKVIEKTVSAVEGCVSSSQSKRCRVTIERRQSGSRMSHAVKLSIPAISYQHIDTLRESFECGTVTERMNDIQKAACMDLNLTNVSIEAQLLEKSSTTGANDFSRGLEYGGVINIQCDTLNGKKWKQRYGIISKGFLYIYKNRNAKKTEHSYPLRQFKSAAECDPEDGENFCFCLRYKNPQAPIIFSCDASDSREKWIEKLYSAISEVKPVSYEVTADSRFGSAGPLLRNKSKKTSSMVKYSMFDEVEEPFRLSLPISSTVGPSEKTSSMVKYSMFDEVAEEPFRLSLPISSTVGPSEKTSSMVNYSMFDEVAEEPFRLSLPISSTVGPSEKTSSMVNYSMFDEVAEEPFRLSLPISSTVGPSEKTSSMVKYSMFDEVAEEPFRLSLPISSTVGPSEEPSSMGEYAMLEEVEEEQFRHSVAISPPVVACGANDLLRGMDYTYCGVIHVQCGTLFGKKWKQRYGIISQGNFYIYTNRNAKKTEHAHPLRQFASAEKCDPEDGENICFCLRYKNPQAPILFACDTPDSREKWIEMFYSAILEVRSVSYNVSADSGFGSAEAVPRNKSKAPSFMDEYARYDEVNEELFRPSDVKSPNQPRDDESGYLSPKALSGSINNKDDFYENIQEKERSTIQSNTARKVPLCVKTNACIGELKQKLNINYNATRTKTLKKDTSSTYAHSRAKEESPPKAKASKTQAHLSGQGSMQSGACSVPSFVSVRGESVAVEESLSHLSVRGQDSLYENKDDADNSNSSDSDNTSPKTIYENPEELERVKPRKFKRKEYMCLGKEKAKKELKQKPVGVFAVFPGESAEMGLCVVTPLGLKYFRIHSQNERVSLFESHQSDTFCSLAELLAYYHDNVLPRKDYSVILERGFNTL